MLRQQTLCDKYPFEIPLNSRINGLNRALERIRRSLNRSAGGKTRRILTDRIERLSEVRDRLCRQTDRAAT